MDTPNDTAPQRGRASLRWPGALFGGWALVALVQSAVMLTSAVASSTARTQALMHLHQVGQALGAGLVFAAMAAFWPRLRVGRGWKWVLLLGGIALASYPLLREDLVGPASRMATKTLGASAILWLMVVGLTWTVAVGASIATWLFHRPWARPIPLAAGVAIVVLNGRILRNDYPGAHLLLQTSAAVLCAVALRGLRLPPHTRWVAAAGVLLALFTLVVPPSNMVWLSLDRYEGAATAPFFARVRSTLRRSPAGLQVDDPWFRSRKGQASTAPSVPPLLHPKRLRVVMLTIDAMRADLMESSKHATALPELTRLRDESAWFRRARAPGSQTVYTFSQIMAGTYYSQQYWTNKTARGQLWLWPHEDKTVRFPQILTEAGVATVNVTPALWMVNSYGVVRGFSEEQYVEPRTQSDNFALGVDLTPPIVDRLESRRAGPLFLFAHNLDPHAPHDRGTDQGTPFERYLSELAVVDDELGRIRRAIADTSSRAPTVLIVTADHGQAFGEHDTTEHGKTLYEELIHVPLFVHGPGVTARAIDTPVTLMDLGPTILDLFGQPTPSHFMGESLVPFLKGNDPELTRPIVAEGRLKQAMVFPDGIKVIRDQRTDGHEIYDINADPGELNNLVESLGKHGETRVGILRQLFEVHRIRRPGYEVPYRR